MIYDYSMMQKRALLYKVAMQKRALLYKAASKMLRLKRAFYGSALDAAYRSSMEAAKMLERQGVHFPVKSNKPGMLSRLKDFISRKHVNKTNVPAPTPVAQPQQTTPRKSFWTWLKENIEARRNARQVRNTSVQPTAQPQIQSRATQEAQAAADRAVHETTTSVPATTVNNNVSNVTTNTVEPPPKINKWLATSIALGMPLTAAGGYYLYNKYYGSPSGPNTPTV